ncbi:MAG: glycosyltransferase [bacterium]
MERNFYLLVKKLVEDHDLEIGVLFSQSTGYYYNAIKKLGCKIIIVKLRRGFDLSKTLLAANYMRQYDIHHFHNSAFPFIIASIISSKGYRILTCRGGRHQFNLIKQFREQLVKFLIHFFFHSITGNTRHAARVASELYRIPMSNIKVTYNVLDFDSIHAKVSKTEVRQELGIKNELVIGSAANFKKWKRLDILIELLSRLTGDDNKLLLIGDGSESRHLYSLACKLGVVDRVIFAGMKKAIFDYMNAIDIFILPSNTGESFGNAAVEAMVLGIPTIVLEDGGGLTEHIIANKTGYIATSFEHLADITLRLKKSATLRKTVGLAGKDHIINKYDPLKTSKVYKDLYTSFALN